MHFPLFDAYINGLVSKLNELHNIKCSLYADDLVFWCETSKRRAEVIQEQILIKHLTHCTNDARKLEWK